MNVNDWTITLARFILAAVWLVAGAAKLQNASATLATIQTHRLVPTTWAFPMSRLLPMVELALGLLLVVNLATRVSAVTSAVLLMLFTVSTLATAAYPRPGSTAVGGCGCFGHRESAKRQQTTQAMNPGPAFARNTLLLTLAVALALLPS
jgi:uncharacterized membrane protein YphA (DoxX/SURF4 family)